MLQHTDAAVNSTTATAAMIRGGGAYSSVARLRRMTIGGEGGVLIIMHGRSRMTMDPPPPYNAGTEHVGFSPSTYADITWGEEGGGCTR